MDSLHTHLIPRHSTSQNNAPGLISDSAEEDITEDSPVEEDSERKPTVYVIPRLKPQVNRQIVIHQRQNPNLPYHLWVFGPIGSETKAVAHTLNQLLGYPAKEVDIMALIMKTHHRQLHEFTHEQLMRAENTAIQALAYNGETTIARIEDESSFSLEALEMMRTNGVVISLEESDPAVLAQRVLLAKEKGEQIPLALANLNKRELINKLGAIHKIQKGMHLAAHVHVKIGTVPTNAVVNAILRSGPMESFLS